MYLCNQLQPRLKHADTHMRKAIPTEQRLAITLWSLATPAEYRTIAHLFGVGRSTVCMIVQETCTCIVEVLQRQYINFPSGQSLQDVVTGFETKWGMIQCAGSIDGCHIPILPPALNHTDYYNRKGWYSIVLQAIVDHEYLFRDIYIGWPGSVHDARIFANSTVFKEACNGSILQGDAVSISGRDIPIFLVGDSAYPLMTWLMKPFAHNTQLTSSEKIFNYKLSRARIVVENAFGRLKARWRRLLKRNDMNLSNIPTVVAACCILHNVCEVHGERFNDQWLESLSELPQPPTTSHRDAGTDAPKEIRNTLAHHFAVMST